jgi:glycine oxidase
MASQSEVVIVGGGITGWAIAWVLGQRGISVTVVERDAIAGHASGMAAGVLNPLDGENIPGPLQPLALDGYRRHLEWWPQLAEDTGIDVQGRLLPLLRVAFDDELEQMDGMDAIDGIPEFSKRRVSPADILRLEPSISEGVAGGIVIEGIGSLDSYLLTMALSRAAQKQGACHIHDTVVGLEKTGADATAVTLENQALSCQAVVLAMGPWTSQTEPWLGHPAPVYPLKGDLLRMVTAQPTSDLIIFHPQGLLSRKLDGLVWAGSSNEEAGFDARPWQSSREQIMAGALRVVPALQEARVVRHTSCLRPQTSDGLPIVGQALGWRNVYIATGAGHKGILVGPSMAIAAADLVTGGRTDMPIHGFGPERFTVSN